LRSGGAFDAAKGQRRHTVVELTYIENQVLKPQGRTLSHGRELHDVARDDQ
jgi:hypothetical protein